MLKKLFSHSLIYGLAPQISKIAGIFALPIITKDLSTIDYGVWGIVLAYTGAFQALFMLGMNVVLANSFFKMPYQHKWLWRQIYGFISLWAIPYSLFLAGLLYYIIPPEAQEEVILLIFLLLFPKMIMGPITILGTYYYQLRQEPLPIAIRTGIFGLLTVILNIYTISYLKMGFMGWAWSTFIVSLLMNLSYWYPLNFKLGYSPIFNFKWRLIRQSFDVSLPTIPHQYSSFLMNSSDRIVMDQLHVTTGDLGGYNLASSFGGYFQTIVGAANQAITPMMLEFYKKQQDIKARNIVFVLQIVILGGTFFFSIWSKEVFELLIKNDSLKQVYPLAIIIAMAYNYRPMYIGAMSKLFYVEKTKLLWRVSFIAGFSNVILNFIFIPIFGFEAAAYTTFASLMYMGFSGHFIKKIREIQNVNHYPMIWLILILLSTLAASYLVHLSILSKIIISLTIILSISIILWLNKKELGFDNGQK